MLIFALDTETTGIPARGEILSSPSYPRLVQLGGILADSETKQEYSSFDVIVKPDGYEIPEEASNIHGIPQALALTVGIPLRLAVALYTNYLRHAGLVVGHNVEYDRGILTAALLRSEVKVLLPSPLWVCTADLGVHIVKLPPTERMVAAGRGHQYKRPKLNELYNFLFGEEFAGAHSALADCRASLRCYFELKDRGLC